MTDDQLDNTSSKRFLDPVLLGTWIAARPYIWQMDLLNGRELNSFAEKHGISFPGNLRSASWEYWAGPILKLWQLGWLRADIVVSKKALEIPGLIEVGTNDRGRLLYADARQPAPDWRSRIPALKSFPKWL